MLSETNILICYMPKTELWMQSYDAMNMSIWIWEFRGLGGIIPPRKSQRGIERSGTAWCGMDPAVWLEGWVDLDHLHQIRVNPDSGEL